MDRPTETREEGNEHLIELLSVFEFGLEAASAALS